MSLARFGGMEVQLVERASFPRKKACGSGLSPWCLELLDGMGLGPAVAKEAFHIGAARIGGPRGAVLELRSKYHAKVMCRTRFDEMLAIVESNGNVLSTCLLQQAAKKTGKTIHRIRRFSPLIDELIRHGKPGTENIDTGVNEVYRW